MPIFFLMTRVVVSAKKGWGKLERVLKFLHGTANDKKIMGAHDIATLITYIDTSYVVHPNIRSRTRGLLIFGKGITRGTSSKQKLMMTHFYHFYTELVRLL